MKLKKATNNDKRGYIRSSLRYSDDLEDFDDTHVYFYKWIDDTYQLHSAPYTMSGVTVSINFEEEKEVAAETTYKEKSSIEEMVIKAVDKILGTKKIAKYADSEMTVIEPLYVAYGQIDAHNETYLNKDSVYQLVDSINEAIANKTLKSVFFHTHISKAFEFEKAWVNEEPVDLGGNEVPALQPLVKVKFNNKKAFELRKSLDILGLSIGCNAKGTKKKDDDTVYLSDFDFSESWCHGAYTDESDGGAASLNNNYYIAKSVKEKDLHKKQKEILMSIGEEFIPLDKSVKAPNKTQSGEGVNDNLNDTDGKQMTEKVKSDSEKEMEKEIVALKAAIKKQNIRETELTLKDVGLSDDELKAVATVLVDVPDEGRDTVISAIKSAFASNSADKDEKIKTLEEEVKELKKSAIGQSDLDTEVGNSEEPEPADTPKSLGARMKAARQAKEQEKEAK